MAPYQIPNKDINKLIALYQSGNEEHRRKAFELIWLKYRNYVHQFVFNFIKKTSIPMDEKEELLQFLFGYLHKALTRYDLKRVKECSFISYMTRWLMGGSQEYFLYRGVVEQKNLRVTDKKRRSKVKVMRVISLNQPTHIDRKRAVELHEKILKTDPEEYELSVEKILKDMAPNGKDTPDRLTKREWLAVKALYDGYKVGLGKIRAFECFGYAGHQETTRRQWERAKKKILRHYKNNPLELKLHQGNGSSSGNKTSM